MYNVNRQNHTKYGNVVEIVRQEIGTYATPFLAVNAAITAKRLWREEGAKKVRFLIDGQVMTVSQAEHWSNEEYKSLPKCYTCAKILGGNVYTHQLYGDRLFCSQSCADKDYSQEVEKRLDEEEIDYL